MGRSRSNAAYGTCATSPARIEQGVQVFNDGFNVVIFSYHGFLTRPDDSRAVFAFSLQFKKNIQTKVDVSLR